MKFLVIGCGSIGERHIKNLIRLSVDKILACDINSKRLQLIKERYNIESFKNIKDALKQNPNVALICTPPNSHISIAIEAINHNLHVFIEKPISHNLENIDELLEKAQKKNLIILVGYNLRFHRAIKLMKKLIDNGSIGKILSARLEYGYYLPDWRPWQDYKKSYTSKSNLGGGIILDSSHEIDYARWIIGDIKEVFCFADKVSDLDVDVEDTAEILLRSKNNSIIEIHLDFIQRCYSRNCKIIGEKGNIIWNFQDNIVKLYTTDTKQWKINQIPVEINDMYIDEMKHFLDCINGNSQPLIDGYTAKEVLKIALAAKESAKSGNVIKI